LKDSSISLSLSLFPPAASQVAFAFKWPSQVGALMDAQKAVAAIGNSIVRFVLSFVSNSCAFHHPASSLFLASFIALPHSKHFTRVVCLCVGLTEPLPTV
jgi:hypothetical protein